MKLTIKKTLCKLDRSGGILYMRHYISRGLYMFYTGLYCRAANITENLCTNQGNSSIFEPNICGLYSRAVSNQERVIMVHVQYITRILLCLFQHHLWTAPKAVWKLWCPSLLILVFAINLRILSNAPSKLPIALLCPAI